MSRNNLDSPGHLSFTIQLRLICERCLNIRVHRDITGLPPSERHGRAGDVAGKVWFGVKKHELEFSKTYLRPFPLKQPMYFLSVTWM